MRKFYIFLLFWVNFGFCETSYKVPFVKVLLANQANSAPNVQSEIYAKRIPTPFYYQDDIDKDKSGAFLISGVNSSETIKNVTHLTGVDIASLTLRAKPHDFNNKNPTYWLGVFKPFARQSKDGFILQQQDLRQVLLFDNQKVLAMGTNHQKISEPLLIAIETFETQYSKVQGPVPFSYQGKNYFIEGRIMGIGRLWAVSQQGSQWDRQPKDQFKSGWVGDGIQGSFFNDDLFGNWEYRIRDASGTKEILGDALTPYLIHRYGFYQSGKYRMDPDKIVAFFR